MFLVVCEMSQFSVIFLYLSINVWLVDEDNYSMEDDPNQLIGEEHDEDKDMK